MPRGGSASEIGAVARQLLESGAAGDGALQNARIGDALPVVDAGGALHSWFVPLLRGESLAGFLQLLPDETLMRSSTFPKPAAAADWLDTERIRARAGVMAGPKEQAGSPVLTFDRNPDRLVWSVPITGKPGGRRVYVAGEAVYTVPGEESGESIGGLE